MRRHIFFSLCILCILVAPTSNLRAQITPQKTDELMRQLQQVLVKSGLRQEDALAQQKKIAMGLAILQIRGCIEQNVGKTATKRFIDEITREGKIIEGLCRQGQATQARKQVIALMKEKEHDPVARAAHLCYTEHEQAFSAISDKISAEELANYERWSENPSVAEQEMKDSDICKKGNSQK